jgi:hypothetical protein
MPPGNCRRDRRSSTWGVCLFCCYFPAVRRVHCAVICPRRVAIAVRLASVRLVKQPEEVPSFRQAAAVCNVSPPVVRRRQDRLDQTIMPASPPEWLWNGGL